MRANSLVILVILSSIYYSCKEQAKTPQLELSCESIVNLMERDQKIRSMKLMNPFFANVDSLMKQMGYEGGLDNLSYLNDEERDSIWSLAKAEIKPLTERQKLKKDSLWKVQRNIDSLNTLEVIRQIQTFGIDSVNRIDATCGHNSLVVFVHSPPGLFSEVETIVNQNAEKIGENRMRHIGWHLNGREN